MQAPEILKHFQLKKTSPRLAIIEALQSAGLPLSETEISKSMGSHYDRTTFYRSMLTLEESGIIHKIVIDKLQVKYALNEPGKINNPADHAHFYCHHCQRLICLNEIHPGPYKLPKGFSPQESEIIIKGLCDKCTHS
ncbi:MAG: Fur family transcriptional regulator [Lentimicrobium sp.]|jgi:Fur family ferric uptake transcriptional regulator